MIQNLLADVPGWLVSTGLVTLAVLAALGGHAALIAAARRTDLYRELEETILRSTRRPGRLLLVLLAVLLVLPELTLPPGWTGTVRHLLQVALILTGAWLVVGASRVFEALVEERYRADVADNLQARRIQTKVRLLRRLVATVVVFLASAAILMTFDPVRRLGISLFASAGVAGLVVGIAAQPTLSNLVAGLQLALTEPIRLDDVVIVEGEWGWVEEISTTYVVVRVWDRRRLVVPLRWFIENPFQNWTRQTADILGSVHLHLDYRTPIEPLRGELRRVLEEEGGEWWDGEVCGLQVVGTSERTIEVRALMSAASSPDAWELRCLVRERLVGWLQEHHPESLPRLRAELDGGPPRSAGRPRAPATAGGPPSSSG